MSEEVIRTTSCCPEAMMGGMMGSMFNRQNNDPMAMAAMMNGGMNSWNNSPWMYLIFLALFGGGGFGWGNRNGQFQDAEIQSKLNQLSTQMQDGNNTNLLMDAIKGNTTALGQLANNLNCDFNQLQSGVCAIQSAIQQVGGKVGYSAERVINAVNLGDMNIVQQLKDCCCQTQQNIIKMGYENQLGQKDIVNGMQQGFSYTNTGIERTASNLGFQISQMACDLKTNANANTQRIIDTLNGHWQEDLQLRLNRAELELSQQRQNATLIAALGTKATTATT
ncbi:hypothetical protein [uncultured Prevotella sp.]|uniref:hypothetical protein n=1 Tax=uncultured Prevotella sp. TaxID=159272 RepID=UPI0027DD27D8|nr:hypothetical protein [uncultured Prevotella sp.]